MDRERLLPFACCHLTKAWFYKASGFAAALLCAGEAWLWIPVVHYFWTSEYEVP